MNNKRGYSVGFAWVFALVSLFGLGILFITFDQVFVGYLVPTIKNSVALSNSLPGGIDNTSMAQIYSGIDKYMTFWHILPFVLFLVIVLFMVVSAIRKEGDSEYR
jgi:hypothetical protein